MKNKATLLFLLTAILLVPGCYFIKQAKGQLEVYFNQVPLSEAATEEGDPEFRRLLSDIPKIKEFAVKRLLLKQNDCYSSYFATEKKGITFVVTAAPKNELKPYVWSFPFIGDVPYKGFFEKRDALALEKELRNKGYDTWIFAASAYSSLGWLNDPVTSPMLRNGPYFLAETIIHEMTHATFYVKSQGDFSEQLASFTGRKGAFQYFSENKGLSEEQLQKIRDRMKKKNEIARIVRKYTPELKNLYRKNLPLSTILKEREAVFSKITEETLKIYPRAKSEYWRFNNARILQYQRYKSESAIFQDFWEKSGKNWSVFWKLVKQRAAELKWSIVSY